MNSFLKEIYGFLKTNYYILIIGFIWISSIIYSSGFLQSLEVIIIFLSHLVADILMSLMVVEFMKWNIMQWYKYQLGWSIIFLLIWLYSLVFHNDSIYLIPSLIYFPVILINMYEYKNKTKIKWLNLPIIFGYALFLFIFTIIYYNIKDIAVIVQFIGVLFFAVALHIKERKIMLITWIFTIILMVLGWIIKLYDEIIIQGIVNWATFSYTILPIVVLVWFIKWLKTEIKQK